MYIYKLGTECDGAEMRSSDVYIPTLVALLVLCFDPSECFQDLHIWSGVVGNKSGKLRYVSRIVTPLQFPLAGPPTNGKGLCGLLCHVCTHKVTETQTLWEVETTADTLLTMVLHLNGLH